MIISVDELRQFVNTDESDSALEFRIQALESFICKYTNNDFINRETGEKDYPSDVKMGAIEMFRWNMNNKDKAGIASETLSRHSVSYFDASESNYSAGFPVSVVGFLKPYMKARF